MNLMTSSKKDTIISMSDLVALRVPESLSFRHVPIQHGELVDMVITTVEEAGLAVTDQQHAISNNEEKYFGLLEITAPYALEYVNRKGNTRDRLLGGSDYRTIIGLRNSHDRSLGAGLVCGSGVMVCSNLCFYGEVKVTVRHVRGIRNRLLAGIQSSLPQVIEMQQIQDDRIASYKRVPIEKEEDIYPILIRATEKGAVSPSQMMKVLDEYREPSFEEFAEDSSHWRLFNAFTHVMKPKGLGRLWGMPERGAALHGVMDRAVGERS